MPDPVSDKTEPVTVWAASSGSYSDYGVGYLFESQEDAEAYVADGGGEFVEEFTLYRAGHAPERVTLYEATWALGGEVAVTSYRTNLTPEVRKLTRPDITEHQWAVDKWRETGSPYPWSTLIGGKCLDEQALRKAMKDRVAAFRVREGCE